EDVVAQDVPQLVGPDRAVLDAAGEPGGQLVVPDQRVAAHLLAGAARVLDHGVGVLPGEDAAFGLDALPLHRVLGGDVGELAVEHLLVVGFGAQRGDVHGAADPDPGLVREVAQVTGLVVVAARTVAVPGSGSGTVAGAGRGGGGQGEQGDGERQGERGFQ